MSATDGIAHVNTLATHTATSISTWGSDFLMVIVLVAAFFLVAWFLGKGSFVSLLLSFYGAYALYVGFPYTSLLPSGSPKTVFFTDVGLFIALTLVFFIILRRVVVSDFLYIGIFGLIILSALGAGFVLALLYHVFPTASVYTFTPAIDALFAPKAWFYWWFVAPVIGLLLFAH